MTVIEQFNRQIKLHHSECKQFLIALSGGLDSMVLLSLFAKFRKNRPHFRLRAVHIHHGLSPNADRWVRHCEEYCARFGIPLIVEKVRVRTANGIEAGAREARYQAIRSLLQAGETLVTAHHQNDQAETFFLALKRGSGVRGLSAMQSVGEIYDIPIFRPLLALSRAQLEDYATKENLSWIEDESNADNRYDRNFLRNEILPRLRRRWHYFDQAVARSARHCAEQQQLLDELLHSEFVKNYEKTDRTLNIAGFADYSPAKQKALLRMWLTERKIAMPGALQLEKIVREVIGAKPDANPQFRLGGHILRRYRQRLFLTADFADLSAVNIPLEIGRQVILPDNSGTLTLYKTHEKLTALWRTEERVYRTALPLTEEPVSLRFGYSGKVKLTEKGANKDIKKIWQNLAVPPWQRGRIPLIFYGERLQSAVGFFTVFAP